MAGIFKAYDIRATVDTPDGINDTKAYWIGRGLASEIFKGQSPIVVGCDMRIHSERLTKMLIKGLMDGGCSVADIGLASTPMNYWANANFQVAGSVQVTASHNGPQYNGFKVSGKDVVPFGYDAGLHLVETYFNTITDWAVPTEALSDAEYKKIDGALEDYITFMRGFFPEAELPKKPMKVAIDAGNGMAGQFLETFFKPYSWIETVPLFWDLDGTFPNHEANPLHMETLVDVQKAVVEHKCDFGVAFDGDADRCVFIDEHGEVVTSDFATALIGEKFLSKEPGTAILYDGRSTAAVPEWISEHGGVPVRGKVGHTFMKKLIKEKSSPFGGELSGHFYYRDMFNADSALMALLDMMVIWQQANKPLSEVVKPLRRYYPTPELNFKVENIPELVQRIAKDFEAKGATVDQFDGLFVRNQDWWFTIRASNTEPLMRLNIEARTPEERDKRVTEMTAIIEGALVAS